MDICNNETRVSGTEKKEQQKAIDMLSVMVKEKLVSIQEAARRIGISIDDFVKRSNLKNE